MEDIRTSQWLDQEDQRVSAMIREYGCALEYIMKCGCEGSFAFCYTIGLHGLGHPELLVLGLDQTSAGGLLNHVFSLIRGGRDLVPGELLTFEQSPEKWLVEQVPNPGEILFAANRHYQRPAEASVRALQLTWSAHGRFPWDEGYALPQDVQPRPGTFNAWGNEHCQCPHHPGCSGPH